jgi:hypothetical protein
MISLYRILVIVLAVIALSACANTRITSRDLVETAAVADVATTQYGLAHGARELNPLGFAGTSLAKLYYFSVLRPGYDPETQLRMDRYLGGTLTMAAVNNLVQIIWAPNILASLAVGMFFGWQVYCWEVVCENNY